MIISQRLWLMALDDSRGLPRASVAPHVVATGLLLDLDAAGLIEWRDDDQVTPVETAHTSAALLHWAITELGDVLKDGAASRFAMNAIVLKTWDRVGQSLTEAGIVTAKRHRLRRNRYHLVNPDTRTHVVDEARELLFSNTEQAQNDPCLAVLSACSVGEEFLSLSPLTDFQVAKFFGSRPDDSPVEQRVWQCVRYTSIRATSVTAAQPPMTPGP